MELCTILSQEQLAHRLGDEDLVLIDCRFTLGKPDEGKELYRADHITGAFYLDLEKDLSGEIKIHGGRHPLPDLGEFSLKMSRLGIHASKTVVAYDDQGGVMASRLWWMLQFLGHELVYVLDLGYQAWKHAGKPISDQWPTAEPQVFSPRVRREWLASIEEVKSKLHQDDVVLVDSRDVNRYLGIEEPIDRVAGHIPRAHHYFWKEVLRSDGSWKSHDQLATHFQTLREAKEIIVYCGSGVTACPNIIGLRRAGFPHVKLYSGSWSDWISYKDNPIETQ